MTKFRVPFTFEGEKTVEANDIEEAHDQVTEWLDTTSLHDLFADYRPTIGEIEEA